MLYTRANALVLRFLPKIRVKLDFFYKLELLNLFVTPIYRMY